MILLFAERFITRSFADSRVACMVLGAVNMKKSIPAIVHPAHALQGIRAGDLGGRGVILAQADDEISLRHRPNLHGGKALCFELLESL